jgi:tetratricopeptide (TPR) repeat protein
VDYLDLANQKAAKLSAMDEAKSYFYEAMELLDALPEIEENQQRRISLLVNQVEVFMLLLKIPEYYDLLTRYEPMAIELGNQAQALLGGFYSRVGHSEFGLGRFDQAIKMSTKGAELCEAAGNAEDAGFAYTWLEWSHLYRGDFDRVLAVKEDPLRTMEQRFNLRWYAWGLCAASRAYVCLSRWDEAVKEGEKALSAAEEFSDNSTICFAARDLSIAYTSKGDLSRAIEYGELMFQKASTPADKAWGQRVLGWSLCRAGETNRGIELLTAALPIFQAGRWMSAVIPASCTLGEGYWLAGEDDKARQTLEEALKVAEHCGARYYVGWAHRFLGEIALKVDPGRAASHFEKCIAVLQKIKAENDLALAYAGYGRLQKQQGQFAQAREYLTKALQIFERLGTLIEPDKVREILAELPAA